MLGQLLDAGNTITLAHYLELLSQAGLVTGLRKYAGDDARRRASSPKLLVLNTALKSALSGLTFEEAVADREVWGRFVESAVGARLACGAAKGLFECYYWREGDREVDYILRSGGKVAAIEVKSGKARQTKRGSEAFDTIFGPARFLLVGGDGIPV